MAIPKKRFGSSFSTGGPSWATTPELWADLTKALETEIPEDARLELRTIVEAYLDDWAHEQNYPELKEFEARVRRVQEAAEGFLTCDGRCAPSSMKGFPDRDLTSARYQAA